ncbi:MAG TPA: hypothetical protein VF895_02780 [Gaiellaceae bacterium]
MTPATRSDRTAKLLSARLECLALAAERPGAHPDVVSGVRLASAATRNAVELHLLSVQEADEIWADTRRRHPTLALLVST